MKKIAWPGRDCDSRSTISWERTSIAGSRGGKFEEKAYLERWNGLVVVDVKEEGAADGVDQHDVEEEEGEEVIPDGL